jgi:diaminopimelate decarboxylase
MTQAKKDHKVRLTPIVPALKDALKRNLLSPTQPCANFFNLDSLRSDIAKLHSCFGEIPSILHAIAVKANPVAGILSECLKLGCGAECASVVEVEQARRLGFPGEKIVYDCPCKSEFEVRQAMELGSYINIDSFSEI